MKRLFFVCSIVIPTLLISAPVMAQLYRCEDDSGKITYSDIKCGKANQRTVLKITDNTMDNSNLSSEAAIRGSLNSSIATSGSSGNVYVLGNSAPQSTASSSAASSTSTRTVTRRRCGG
ncbi:MAG: DUF4124 domain-containing protein [Burkholderiales bacterium]|jgi:hypothetical protein|nr:DUF4124 domain-containing protein [Burkholderiales bacterium]